MAASPVHRTEAAGLRRICLRPPELVAAAARPVRGPLRTGMKPGITAIKAVHSGSVGDYIFWLVAGAAVLTLTWGATPH